MNRKRDNGRKGSDGKPQKHQPNIILDPYPIKIEHFGALQADAGTTGPDEFQETSN